MKDTQILWIGLMAAALSSGAVEAQDPPLAQSASEQVGQFKSAVLTVSDQPKKTETSSSGAGILIVVAIVVGIIIWLCNNKKSQGPVPIPIPIPVVEPRPAGDTQVSWWPILIGLGLLALAFWGCSGGNSSDKPKSEEKPNVMFPKIK